MLNHVNASPFQDVVWSEERQCWIERKGKQLDQGPMVLDIDSKSGRPFVIYMADIQTGSGSGTFLQEVSEYA